MFFFISFVTFHIDNIKLSICLSLVCSLYLCIFVYCINFFFPTKSKPCSVHLDCYTALDWVANKQQTFISFSSGGWKFRIKAPAW